MEKKILQDYILDKLQQERQTVTLFTTNGFQMKGRITAFDQDMIVVEIRNEQQFIYKHAVSTIVPASPMELEWEGK